MLDRIKSLLRSKWVSGPALPPAVDWLSSVAIKGSVAPYENLPPVAGQPRSDPWVKLDAGMLEQSLDKYLAEDSYPLPSTADREGYHGSRHYDYWLSGLKDYLSIKRALEGQNVRLEGPFSVFDFGCASGRVLRHFLCHEQGLELWGSDINLRHVEWIRRFLAPSIRVFHNTALPFLPLEDNSLQLVYAFSVFTHIDSLELAWLAELRRVLKCGGLAYLTIHSEHTWENMDPQGAVCQTLMAVREYIREYRVSTELFERPMPAERAAFSWQIASVNNAIVFHSLDYIRNAWGRFFDVVDIIPKGHDYQDVVVLRKS